MSPKIVVVDYGMGNLRSVQKALETVGASVVVSSLSEDVSSADGVVLPGVGAFDTAMRHLEEGGLTQAVKKAAEKKPFLGICLGLQLLFQHGEEGQGCPGLGILPGKVVRFAVPPPLKVPHMGWNRIHATPAGAAAGLKDGDFFYFVHSYYGVCEDASAVAATTEYGAPFCSAVVKGNLLACQFHPEKSGANGLSLLKTFVEKVNRVCHPSH